MNIWALWCACGFVGWMGAETLNAEDDGDLFSLRLEDRGPFAHFLIFTCGLVFGPMLLAIVFRRFWDRK
jgi:hypothetical protein